MDNEPADNDIFDTVTWFISIGHEVLERSLGSPIILTSGRNVSRQSASERYDVIYGTSIHEQFDPVPQW